MGYAGVATFNGVPGIPENTQPTLRIVSPGHPTSDRAIEVIFPEHVTVRPPASTDANHLYLWQPGQYRERPLWRRSAQALEYERNLPGAVHMLARATLEGDGVRFQFRLRNQSDKTYDLIWAPIDPRLTSLFHDHETRHRAGNHSLSGRHDGRTSAPIDGLLPKALFFLIATPERMYFWKQDQQALQQEQCDSCDAILNLAVSSLISLVVPAFSLVEPHQALALKAKARNRLSNELRAGGLDRRVGATVRQVCAAHLPQEWIHRRIPEAAAGEKGCERLFFQELAKQRWRKAHRT